MKTDGNTKNDSEGHASTRLLLDALNIPYVIRVKPGDHPFLFDWMAGEKPTVYSNTMEEGTRHIFHISP